MPHPAPSGSADPDDEQSDPARVTLRQIAQAVGVTPMTVSRALRNQPRVSATMRAAIHAKALELGYQPDPMVTALVHYRNNRQIPAVKSSLAWLNRWPDPKQLRQFREFDLYWQGASLAAKKLGFRLEEFVVNESMSPERQAHILHTRNVRGILLPPGPFADGWTEKFPWGQFSIVGLGRTAETLPVHIVTSDQTANTMLAFEKLRERGFKRIGFVGEPWKKSLFCPGFLWSQCFESPDDRVPPLLFPRLETDRHADPFARWLREHTPDAILTENPRLPELIAQQGLRVPEDVGLAALTVLDCPIDTGIHQNPEEIGRVGVLMLNSLINDNDRGFPAINRQILVKGRWVDGVSLGSPRATA